MGGCASTQLDHRYDCSFYIIQGAEALANRKVSLAVKKFAEARRQLPHFELLQESSQATTTTASVAVVSSAPVDGKHHPSGGPHSDGARNPLLAGAATTNNAPKTNKNSNRLLRRPSQPNIVAQNFFTGGSDGNVTMGPSPGETLAGSGQKQFSSDDERDHVDPDAGISQEELESRKVEKELRSALRTVRRESLGYGNLMVGVDMFDLAMLAGELPPSEFQTERAENNDDGYYQTKRHNNDTNTAISNSTTTATRTDKVVGNSTTSNQPTTAADGTTPNNTSPSASDIKSSSQDGAPPKREIPFQASMSSGNQTSLIQSGPTSSSSVEYSIHSQHAASMLAPQESMAIKSTDPAVTTQHDRLHQLPSFPGISNSEEDLEKKQERAHGSGGAVVAGGSNGGRGGDTSSGGTGVMSISDGDECDVPIRSINPAVTLDNNNTASKDVAEEVPPKNNNNDAFEFAADTDFLGGGQMLTRTSSILVNKSKHSYHHMDDEEESYQRNSKTPPLMLPPKTVKWDAVDFGSDKDDNQQLKSGGSESTPHEGGGSDTTMTPPVLKRKAAKTTPAGKRQSVVDFDLGGSVGGGGNASSAHTNISGTHRTPQWQRDRDTLRLDFSSRFGTFGLGNEESAFFEPPPSAPSPKNALGVSDAGINDNAELSVRDATILTLSCKSGSNLQQLSHHLDHEDGGASHNHPTHRDSHPAPFHVPIHPVPPSSTTPHPHPPTNHPQSSLPQAAPVPASRLLTAASTLNLLNTTDPMVLSKLGDVLNAMLVIADHFLSWGHIALAERNYLIVSGVAFILGRSARHKHQYIVILYKRLRDRANLGVSWSLLERGRRMHRNTKHSRNVRMSLFAVALQHSVAVRVNQEGNPEVVAELMRGQYNSSLQARMNYLDYTKKRTASKNVRGSSKDNSNVMVLQDERAAYEVFCAEDRSSSDSSFSDSEIEEEKLKLKKIPSILIIKPPPPPATTSPTADVSSGNRNNSNTSSSSNGATTQHTATEDSSTSLFTPTKALSRGKKNDESDGIVLGGAGPFIYGAVPWGVWTWEDAAQQELRAAIVNNSNTDANNHSLPMRRNADVHHKITLKGQPTSRGNTNIKQGKKKLKADFLSGKAMTLTNTAEATSDVLLPDGARLWLGEPLIDALVLEACTRLEMVLESYNNDRATAANAASTTIASTAAQQQPLPNVPSSPGTVQISVPSSTDLAAAGSIDTLEATTPNMIATAIPTASPITHKLFSLSTHHQESPPRPPSTTHSGGMPNDDPPGTNEDASLIILKVQKALGLVAMKLGVHSVEYAKVGSLLEACRTALQWNTRDRHRLNRPKQQHHQSAESPLDDSQQGMGNTSPPQHQHLHTSPIIGGRRQRTRSVVQILEDAWAANNDDETDVGSKPLNQFAALIDSSFASGKQRHVPREVKSGTLKAPDGGETSFFGSFSEGAGSRS